MKNTFNECNRASFLAKVSECFLGILAWMYWCYAQPAELCFGDQCILASAAWCTAGRSLRPLAFLSCFFGLPFTLQDSTCLSSWYLDDGTFIGPQSSITTLLTLFSQDGPAFGLYLNLAKCEIFWLYFSGVSCGCLQSGHHLWKC